MDTNPDLHPVRSADDIFPAYRGTPVAELLAYHNLRRLHPRLTEATLLIGMCMDHRMSLRIPANFAYVLRVGGANLARLEFKVSYAVALKGIRAVALIGHEECGMADLGAKRDAFVAGLVRAGWAPAAAAAHFDRDASAYAIPDPVAFLRAEARRLRARYPRLVVAPLLYGIADGRLSQVREGVPAAEPAGVGHAGRG